MILIKMLLKTLQVEHAAQAKCSVSTCQIKITGDCALMLRGIIRPYMLLIYRYRAYILA
jgi:hypothetical protein